MSTTEMNSDQGQKTQEMAGEQQQIVFGDYKVDGTAGPDAKYIQQTLERWRLRGDGYLK